jgi:hypothetical protein
LFARLSTAALLPVSAAAAVAAAFALVAFPEITAAAFLPLALTALTALPLAWRRLTVGTAVCLRRRLTAGRLWFGGLDVVAGLIWLRLALACRRGRFGGSGPLDDRAALGFTFDDRCDGFWRTLYGGFGQRELGCGIIRRLGGCSALGGSFGARRTSGSAARNFFGLTALSLG